MKLNSLIFYTLSFVAILIPAEAYSKYQQEKTILRLMGPRFNGGGTGFEIIYHGHQYTMTNAHVCELGADEGYLVALSNWAPLYRLKIIAESPLTDLCLLSPVPYLPALTLGNGDLRNGDLVYVLGHPFLNPLTKTSGETVNESHFIDVELFEIGSKAEEAHCSLPKHRIISQFFGLSLICTEHLRSQLITAEIHPGSSGSPVFDSRGYVRGVVFASQTSGELANQAEIVPWSELNSFLAYACQSAEMR